MASTSNLTAPSPRAQSARSAALLFAGLLLLMAIPYQPLKDWNVNTRLNLIFAIVDRGTLHIDAYHDTPPYDTMDKAVFDGHYYSDKTFGSSLPAIPLYWLMQRISGDRVEYHPASYILKGFVSALPGALAGTLSFLLLVLLGTPPRRALLLVLFFILGSMWYGYSTLLYPYSFGIATLLGAIYLVFFPPARRMTRANCFGIGFLLGYTLFCDLIFGIAVFAVGAAWLLRILDQAGWYPNRAFAEMTGDRSGLREVAVFSAFFWLGVIIPLLPFFAYCYAIFGTLSIPYQYEVSDRFREGMAQGLMGATTPKLHAFYFITIHPYRGIFFWSPILLAGVGGALLAMRQYGKRLFVGCMALFTLAGYLLFTSSYYMWWGGWAMGPRFMLPMYPLLLLACGEIAREGTLSAFVHRPKLGRWTWRATVLAGALSIALSLPVSLFAPNLPQGNQDHVLATADIRTRLEVPHFHALEAFYGGHVTIWPWDRLAGSIGSENRLSNIFGLLLLLGGTTALCLLAWRAAPARLPGTQRHDFPFRTIDGSAGPPPPRS